MEITKPKKNQILLEDDAFTQFNMEVKSKTGLSDGEFDELYEGFIFAYRNPGMDASKQIFSGDICSILTLMTSMIENLLNAEVMDEKDLKDMCSMAVKEHKRRKRGK